MLGNAFNHSGKTNLVGAKTDAAANRLHLSNSLHRWLNEYFGIFTIIVVILILVLSYQFILRPKYQAILTKVNTNTLEARQLAPKYQELADYEKLATAYSQLDPLIIEKHSGLVPKEYIKEDLFAETLYLLSHNGYDVKALDVSREGDTASSTGVNSRQNKNATKTETSKTPAGIGVMRTWVSVAGIDYPGLKKLLGIIEHNLRLTDVQQITFDPGTKTAVLGLTTYYLKK